MKIDNVADLIAETLAQAGVKRIFGVVGDSLNGLTDALRKRKAIDWIHVRHEEVAAFAAAAKRRSPASLPSARGRAARQSASHQRSVRCAPQPHAGARHRRADSVGRNRRRLFSGDASAGPVPGMQPLLRTGFRSGAIALRLENAIRAAVGRRGVAVIVIPGDIALRPAPKRGISPNAGLLPAAPIVRRPKANWRRWPNSSTAPSASRCSAAAAVPAPMTA
jgi:pyruvate dehydrogenase (quinone)